MTARTGMERHLDLKTGKIKYNPKLADEAIGTYKMSPRATMQEMQEGRYMLNSKFYSGHVPQKEYEDVLNQDLKKNMISGYAGHIPHHRQTYGKSFDKTVDDAKHMDDPEEDPTPQRHPTNNKTFGERMDRQVKYMNAIRRVKMSGQSQRELLKLLQAKLQERVNSYADQMIKMKLIFDVFDVDKSGELAYPEFNEGLELLNVQFNPFQSLALFAFFDTDYSGEIDYDEFSRLAMLPNPKGGTAIYPKPITTNARDHAERVQLETRTIDEAEIREKEEMHKTFHEQLRPDPDSYIDLKDNSSAHEFYGNVTSMHFGLNASAQEKDEIMTGGERQAAEAEKEAYRRKFHTRAGSVWH